MSQTTAFTGTVNMSTAVHLRRFQADELILKEEDTLTILLFFWPTEFQLEAHPPVSVGMRSFAQALLIEAIDASYAMGFVDALFRSTSNPSSSAVAVIKRFGRQASQHWFDHAEPKDLRDIKIYESVRRTLALSFRTKLLEFLNGLAKKDSGTAVVAFVGYTKPGSNEKVWG